MTTYQLVELLFFNLLLLILSVPLGDYMLKVYHHRNASSASILPRLERICYRLAKIDPAEQMQWKRYATSLLIFHGVGTVFVYLIQRLQGLLPLNPQGFKSPAPDLAFNTAVSFVTNTNWQAYGGETTMSYFTQMFALTVQNFLSAAAGIALVFVLIRAFSSRQTTILGNFWVDLIRITLRILLPLSVVLALLLISQGVIQNFSPYVRANLITPVTDTDGHTVSQVEIPMGPAASQVAIKQLGTNGGGFFNVNSAHPFENPTPLSNFLEMFSILIIAGALCHTFGRGLGRPRDGWTLYAAMHLIFIAAVAICLHFEAKPNPQFPPSVQQVADSDKSVGGNLEGKELRFGVGNSALWATATTAASNGSVNSMHDSFTPLGGMIPMIMMQLGEVVFGGVGSGLYGMIAFAIVTVFLAGLMVGRTPEYLGKKLGPFEMKMVALVVLIPPALVLIGTAIGVAMPNVRGAITNPGPHGFSQVLYAYSSLGNNNGSAFAGFGANLPLHNILGAVVMFISRLWVMIPILALSGSVARKNITPTSVGTLRTDTGLFTSLLVATVLLVGLLNFVPALALGPIAEQLASPRSVASLSERN